MTARKKTPQGIRWELSASDRALIAGIMERAKGLIPKLTKERQTNLRMDITACHCNGMPLDLARLLDADDFNFLHDVVGISRHIDRTTAQLQNHFLPRFNTGQGTKQKRRA